MTDENERIRLAQKEMEHYAADKVIGLLLERLDAAEPVTEIAAAELLEQWIAGLPDDSGESFRAFSAVVLAKLWFEKQA